MEQKGVDSNKVQRSKYQDFKIFVSSFKLLFLLSELFGTFSELLDIAIIIKYF